MYYFIKGKFVTKGENYVAIDNNNIGYKIHTSGSALEQLDNPTEEIMFYTHLHLREDIMDLYGFLTKEELNMFQKLISVSGVGPKAALSILSVTTPTQFALAVITGDVKTITKASGVGPKLAQRIILELKDKLKSLKIEEVDDLSEQACSDTISEATSALIVLGYSAQDAKKAVLSAKGETVEELVREALKKLMK